MLARIRRALKGSPWSREEIQEFIEQSETDLDAEEKSMLSGVLEVSETQVRDVMVPRSHMVVIDIDERDLEEAERRALEGVDDAAGGAAGGEAGEQGEQRRLARSRGADDGHGLSRGDREADVGKDGQTALGAANLFADIVCRENGPIV